MKNPFRGDPVAALDKTRRKLADVEANIAGLQASRTEKLAQTDDIAEIQAIDKAIEAERINAEIYRDKIKALQEECRKQEYQRREDQRTGAIVKIKEQLKKREILAADLQATIERVGTLYTELITPDEIEIEWPFSRPGNGFALIDRRAVDRETAWQFHGLVHQYRLPEPSSAGLGVVGITAQGIAGAVRAQNENIIARLETAPIADDLLDEAV